MHYYKAVDKESGEPRLAVIQHDDQPENPMDNWDSVGKGHRPLFILTNHRRYRFGDKDAESLGWDLVRAEPLWNENWTDEDNPCCLGDELPDLWEAARRVEAYVLPVYMYDHSGVSLSTSRIYTYNDPWDSGILGFILWTRGEVARCCSGDPEPDKEKIYKDMQAYFDEYAAYVSGDVYGIGVYGPGGLDLDEVTPGELDDIVRYGADLESRWGYYGYAYAVRCLKEHFNLVDLERLL
jgi:hypothetical protein